MIIHDYNRFEEHFFIAIHLALGVSKALWDYNPELLVV